MKALLLAVGLLVGAAVGLITDPAPCEEDEVLAVIEDTNPAHGLTWVCINREEFIP